MRRIGIGMTTNMKMESTHWIARHADRMGVNSIWIGEDIGLGQDITAMATSCLLQTKGVRVGTGIMPITVHDALRLARVGATLQQMGEGRFVLGIGLGGLRDLERIGMSIKKPVTEMRTTIDILRRLWMKEPVDCQSELHSLHGAALGMKQSISVPLFLGVRGIQMIELAGELADGVILSGPFDYLRDAIGVVDRVAERVKRHRSSVERVVWIPTIIGAGGSETTLAKRVVAIVVADTPPKITDNLDLDQERIAKIREAVTKGGPDEGAAHVDSEVIEMFSITGDTCHMADRFEELYQMGATEVLIGPPFSSGWRESIAALVTEITRRRTE